MGKHSPGGMVENSQGHTVGKQPRFSCRGFPFTILSKHHLLWPRLSWKSLNAVQPALISGRVSCLFLKNHIPLLVPSSSPERRSREMIWCLSLLVAGVTQSANHWRVPCNNMRFLKDGFQFCDEKVQNNTVHGFYTHCFVLVLFCASGYSWNDLYKYIYIYTLYIFYSSTFLSTCTNHVFPPLFVCLWRLPDWTLLRLGEQPDVSGSADGHRVYQDPVLCHSGPRLGSPLRDVPRAAAALPERLHTQPPQRGVPGYDSASSLLSPLSTCSYFVYLVYLI